MNCRAKPIREIEVMNRKQNSIKQEQIQIGAQIISYTLTFAPRKGVGITIRPDMSVAVRAPQSMSRQQVAQIIRRRSGWILRHLQKFAERSTQPPPVAKSQGESYAFLGKQIPLKILSAATLKPAKEQVTLENHTLHVWAKEPTNKKRVGALLEKWIREQAKLFFCSRMATLYAQFKGQIVNFPDLAIRRMKACWGSCSSKGAITLNLKLIHLDPALIDYVVMHELCHLIEHNHSKHFYALLTRMMPDWEQRRERLNQLPMPE